MLLKGNCLETLKTLEDNSIDSVVSDPPYELGFMGKSWDNSGIAYSVELWTEVLRVLKPGGHLLAFSGTRTYHRMAVAIEDAGFEIRDSIHWTYGSGFPKSLDVSKAIDKTNGEPDRLRKFTAWMRTTGLTARSVNEILQKAGAISANGTMGGHYFDKTQPAIPTAELWAILRPHCGEIPAWVDELVDRIEAEREVVGTVTQGKLAVAPGQDNDRSAVDLDITAPSTPEAQQWQGWGTALKPSHEPIVVARKPLQGTVASNVLTWGTGGLNIDGTRVGSENTVRANTAEMGYHGGNVAEQYNTGSTDGRWPANTIITHSPDCETECVEGCPVLELDGQSGERPSGGAGKNQNSQTANFGGGKHSAQNSHASTGGASRFFTQTTYTEADWPVFLYYAKASKRERNQGLDELEERQTTGGGGLSAEVREDGSLETASAGGKYGSIKAKQSNIHPTVKPVELMRHLIRLVTPKGGTVLDPFLGSGTTAVAAILEGDNWVGCELTEDYWQIIEGRTEWAQEQAGKTLF